MMDLSSISDMDESGEVKFWHYASMFQSSTGHYYIVSNNREESEIYLDPMDVEHALSAFERFDYVVTLDAFTTFFKTAWSEGGRKNSKLLVNHNDRYFYPAKPDHNVVDIMCLSNLLQNDGYHWVVEQAFEACVASEELFSRTYPVEVLEVCDLLTRLCNADETGVRLHNLCFAPLASARRILLPGVEHNLLVQNEKEYHHSLVQKRPFLNDGIVVVWYTFPLLFKQIGLYKNTDERVVTFKRCVKRLSALFDRHCGKSEFVENLVRMVMDDRNLNQISKNLASHVRTYLQTCAGVMGGEIVSIHSDFIIVHYKNYMRPDEIQHSLGKILGAPMKYKHAFTHFEADSYGVWCGVDHWMGGLESVVLHGVSENYEPVSVKKAVHLSFTNAPVEGVDEPRFAVQYDPSKCARFVRLCRIGYTVHEFDEEAYERFPDLHDASFMTELFFKHFTVPARPKRFSSRDGSGISFADALRGHAARKGFFFLNVPQNQNCVYFSVQCEFCMLVTAFLSVMRGSSSSGTTTTTSESKCDHVLKDCITTKVMMGASHVKVECLPQSIPPESCVNCFQLLNLLRDSGMRCIAHDFLSEGLCNVEFPNHYYYKRIFRDYVEDLTLKTVMREFPENKAVPITYLLNKDERRIMMGTYSGEQIPIDPFYLFERSGKIPHANVVVKTTMLLIYGKIAVLFMRGFIPDMAGNAEFAEKTLYCYEKFGYAIFRQIDRSMTFFKSAVDALDYLSASNDVS